MKWSDLRINPVKCFGYLISYHQLRIILSQIWDLKCVSSINDISCESQMKKYKIIIKISMFMIIYIYIYICVCGGPGRSVGIATDCRLEGPGSNSGGDEIFRPSRPALGPNQHSCKMGTGSFPGAKCGRSVLLTTHALLVPGSWKSRAIPLFSLWATPDL